MRLVLRDGHPSQIEGVAGRRLEGPDPALAQDDLGVAALRDVLGRLEPFLDGHREAPLQHHRLVREPDLLQQLEVLRVAGPDADAVGDVRDVGDLGHVHDLDHDRQAELAACLLEDLDPLLSESLERVWRRPRLVDVAPDDRGAGLLRRADRAHRLLGVLDRAWAGDQRERVATDRDGADLDDRGLGMQVPRDHLVRLPDLDHVIDALHLAPIDRLESLGVADEADDRMHRATGDERLAAVRAHAFRDGVDLGVRRLWGHHHDHAVEPPRPARSNGPGSRNPGHTARGRSLLGGRWRLRRVVPAVEEPDVDAPLHLEQMVADGGRGWQAAHARRR